jgi:nitronate monooxygenase
MSYPIIIQGGMGVNISSWFLARTVSMLGQLGTVSGVALEKVLVVMLQMGDHGGHIRRALDHFPFPHISDAVWREYYVDGGVRPEQVMRRAPFFTVNPTDSLVGLTVCANFVFVWLAKEGHQNPVSINFLEKIAMPHLYAVFGAMLAGVDFVTVGAGIPIQFPALMSSYVTGEEAHYVIPVIGKTITEYRMSFDPRKFFGEDLKNVLPLKRPGFLPIVASNLLATILTDPRRLPIGSVTGLVVEGPLAGGHNAPPRKRGVYGLRDEVKFDHLAGLGLPFWIGGACASPEKLAWARSVGAQGLQVGSLFALCNESGMKPSLRRQARRLGYEGNLPVRTDMRFSPSGYPFKVAELEGTVAIPALYEARVRVCDRGALQHVYERVDGTIGYRCPSEPVETYARKGGEVADTVGRGCLCNGLLVTAGLSRDGDKELPVVTLGDDLSFLRLVMTDPHGSYSASDAMEYLLGSS